MAHRDNEEIVFSAPLWLNKNSKEFLQKRRIELLEMIELHGSISQAAKACGISYRGAWSAVNSMNNLADKPLTINEVGGVSGGGTSLTEEGRRLIQIFLMIESEHDKALLNLEKKAEDPDRILNLMRRISMRISAKNVLYGIIRAIKAENLLAEVCFELKSGHEIYSIITVESLETLGLSVGDGAYAVIKASAVMISHDIDRGHLSSRNMLPGKVVSARAGAVMGEVILDIGSGDTVTATVSAGGVRNLNMCDGDDACAVIEASNIIIGVV